MPPSIARKPTPYTSAGVSEDVVTARETQALIREQLRLHDTVLLPAHDPAVFARLAAAP